MKTMSYSGDRFPIDRLLEEFLMIGYEAEIVDNELLVYYGKQPRKTKKQVEQEKAERWSKRERNFGYTRG